MQSQNIPAVKTLVKHLRSFLEAHSILGTGAHLSMHPAKLKNKVMNALHAGMKVRSLPDQ